MTHPTVREVFRTGDIDAAVFESSDKGDVIRSIPSMTQVCQDGNRVAEQVKQRRVHRHECRPAIKHSSLRSVCTFIDTAGHPKPRVHSRARRQFQRRRVRIRKEKGYRACALLRMSLIFFFLSYGGCPWTLGITIFFATSMSRTTGTLATTPSKKSQ